MKSQFSRWLALAGLAALAGCQTPAEAPCTENCTAAFVDPVAGEEILDRTPHGTIEVTVGGGDVPLGIDEVTGARLEFAREGEETWTPAEIERAAVSNSMVPPDAVSMRAIGVPAGSLRLRAQFTGPGGILYQAAPTPITILRSPTAKGRVTAAGPNPNDGNKVDVKFDGSGSTDGAGNASGITEWEWDFGDGSPKVKNKTPGHTYARRGKYMVTLCVKDAKGNQSYQYYEVDLSPGRTPPTGRELPVWQDCKCTKMTIDHRPGKTFTGYRNNKGFKGTVNRVDNTVGGPYRVMYYGFEVIAEIEGNPDKCYEWQEIMRTSRDLSGKESHFKGRHASRLGDRTKLRNMQLPSGKDVFPLDTRTNKFGLDGYEKIGPTKLHLPGIIRWKDRPGQPGGIAVQPLSRSKDGYEYKALFNTFVGGPKGNADRARECSCRFYLHLEVRPSGTTWNDRFWPLRDPRNPTQLHPLNNKCHYNP